MSNPPIYQSYKKNGGSYRNMRYPLQQQPLQLLYPGRLYVPEYHFTRDNIPNEDPEGLARTKYQGKAFQDAASIESEAMSRELGGKGKVLRHPAVMPEASIEDPLLSGVTIDSVPNPNLKYEPNQFSLAKAKREVNKLARDAEESGIVLPLVHERFQKGSQADRQFDKRAGKDILDSFTESNGPGIIFFVLIAVVALMIIGLIIYGLSVKSKE